ncbi:MAG: putative baseplate assembly protein [Leptolyngbyaceae bacterium]|nr:putative baseplate assembly protein [Leptolyngbyaceae bacterium]
MEFDFLPNLPKSDLDDRTLDDLMTESRLRIPRYCPEWTNFNPSDPGMTLVELFGWMTEQMLMRFNQVPRRQYVAFLELLGIRLNPPIPAQADLTFYLNTVLPEPYTIPEGIEVATMRTETEDAVVFTTDRPLRVGKPRLQHFLTSSLEETTPQNLRDRLTNRWSQDDDGAWDGPEQLLFDEQPTSGNAFYLVFEPDEVLDGNVLALTVKGEAATATGINPSAPPRRWEAWDGTHWVSILRTETDDGTQGFSFSTLTAEGLDPLQGGDVILHLPQTWPVSAFSSYRGRWVRCVCIPPTPAQPAYSRSPRIVGLSVRAIGGSVRASQATVIEDEPIGVSDGTSNQSFQLLNTPVLPRRDGEYLEVTPPNGLPQHWQEVSDFADSTPDSLHYILDAQAGTVQFGPLIREPAHVQRATEARRHIQEYGHITTELPTSTERLYGAIPPRGARLRMVRYRTGGGARGNVQAGTVRVLKTAIPYVADVINHDPAQYGVDAESLEQAVIRVPKLLRSRDRAVTPEDFEALVIRGGEGAIAQARCLSAQVTSAQVTSAQVTGTHSTDADAVEPGTVKVLVVPHAPTAGIPHGQGIHPEQFTLSPRLRHQLTTYLDERKLLGTHVVLAEPTYVGVSVRAEIGLAPVCQSPQAQDALLQSLLTKLYRFLNPITGGEDGQGWPFGRPVYPSDVIALIQQTQGVQYLGTVQLFELRSHQGQWIRKISPGSVYPGANGLICSWYDRELRSGHFIRFVRM